LRSLPETDIRMARRDIPPEYVKTFSVTNVFIKPLQTVRDLVGRTEGRDP
jgi:hypothetical protein